MRMRLFWLRAGRLAKLPEVNRRLNVVAQDRLAGVDIAGEHGVDAFAQQRFAEGVIACDPLNNQSRSLFAISARSGWIVTNLACLARASAIA